jgi:hypothetical protein
MLRAAMTNVEKIPLSTHLEPELHRSLQALRLIPPLHSWIFLSFWFAAGRLGKLILQCQVLF